MVVVWYLGFNISSKILQKLISRHISVDIYTDIILLWHIFLSLAPLNC